MHSLRTLLADLATLTLNEVALTEAPDHTFLLHARPTPVEQKAFDLLGVDPERFVASTLTDGPPAICLGCFEMVCLEANEVEPRSDMVTKKMDVCRSGKLARSLARITLRSAT